MNNKIVVEKLTGKIIKSGYCNFADDSDYDSEAQEIIEYDYNFSERFGITGNYYYDYVTKQISFVEKVLKTPGQFMADVVSNCENSTQLSRVMDMFDKYSSMVIAMNACDHDLFISRLDLAMANEDIAQADYDMIIGQCPEE